MTRNWDAPTIYEHDGVLEIMVDWRRNADLRPAIRIADDRCKPLFREWARRAAGFGIDMEALMHSCYLQGVTDGVAAADRRSGTRT